MSKVRIGTRESILAVRQAEIVKEAIQTANPAWEIELVKIKTKGDKVLDKRLDTIGGKGLFIKELEQALLDGTVDIAVHSYKDVPWEGTEDLPVVALSERESPFDALVLPKEASKLSFDKPTGSSSQRRAVQFKALYGEAQVESVRGNILTRLEKLDGGGYSAIILAEAGLNRLALQGRITKIFTPEEMIPSASQGIIAVQGRKGELYPYLADFHSKTSEIASRAERQFLQTLEAGCSAPVAAYAQVDGTQVKLMGLYADEAGNLFKGDVYGDIKEAALLGENLAKMLKEKSKKGDIV